MSDILKLGVNIDHVATLRQVRGTPYPSVLEAAQEVERAGAHGVTVHLREDRRHIQDADVVALADTLQIPLNLEMANVPEIVDLAVALQPEEVCLVPERRAELTTEGGLDVAGSFESLRPTVKRLQDAGITVSLFIEAETGQLEAASRMGATVVELHSGSYCDASGPAQGETLQALIEGARVGHGLGLQINAGHGIHLGNLPGIMRIPHLDTLNIGHSIVARSVFVGLQEATIEMLNGMAEYAGGEETE